MSRQDDLRDLEAALRRVGRIGRSREAARLRAEVAGVELSNAAAGILSALYRHGRLRSSALAEAADTEAPLVSRELRALTALGYVSTVTDPTDGRARLVSLTRKGRLVYERYRRATDAITAHALRQWDDDDLATLRTLLDRVVLDFSTPGRPGPPLPERSP